MVDKKVWPMIMMHAPLKPGTSEGTETCGECISVVLFPYWGYIIVVNLLYWTIATHC